MKLLVGLGNPGSKYARHRHNVGFMALDEIIARNDFAPVRKRFQAECAEGRIGGEQVLAIKPQTFMNESGRAVSQAARFYKTGVEDIIVLHDEIDLAAGKVRVKRGGGLAGHNGLKSIAAHLGPDFVRVRIGIGHPGDKARVHRYVLGDFAKADADWLGPLLDALAENSGKLVTGDHANLMNALAGAGQTEPKLRAADNAPPAPVSPPKPRTAKGGKPAPTSQQQLARQAAASKSKRAAQPRRATAAQGADKAPASTDQVQEGEAAQGPFAALRRLLRGGRGPD